MDTHIIAAVIMAIATVIAAVISAWVFHQKGQNKGEEKTVVPGSNYQLLLDAYRLGIGMSWLMLASSFNSEVFKTSAKVLINTEHDTILRLAARVVPQERFPSVHSLIQQVFTSTDLQTANALHAEITNVIFDNYSPAIQVAYVFGVYIPVLKYCPSNPKVVSLTLDALQPLRGTVYKASNIFPKNFISWYEDILAKRNIESAASKIIDWFNSLK